MALDGILIYKLLENLKKDLPARINQIYGVSNQEFLFQIKPQGKKQQLLISVHPNNNRIQYTYTDYDDFSHPSNFVMLLRKHLNNGTIVDYKQFDMDRYFQIIIEAYDEIGDLQEYRLHLELMGRYANLILTDANNRIFDAVKRVSPIENQERPIIPGATYIQPLSQDKINFFDAQTIDTNTSLVKTYSGMSFGLASEIQYRLQNQTLAEIQQEILTSNELIITQNDKQDYHVIEFSYLNGVSRKFDLHHGFDYLYYQKSMNERIKNETNDLLRFVNREIKRLTRRLTRIEEDLIKSENADQHRLFGDLIITYQNKIKRGMKFVDVINYENNEPITIPLDPKRDAIGNSQKQYKQYRKLTNSVKHLLEQQELAETDLTYFNALKQQLELADLHSAQEIRAELIQYGYLQEHKIAKTRKKKKPKISSIDLGDGVILYYGKNNSQNDYVTFTVAANNHYWFHTQGYHGSHVVLNTDNPSTEHLELAGMVAAYFSQARDSENIPVDYTQKKNIKKIPKAKPGFVQVLEHETMMINIDFDQINKLLES